MSDLAQIWEVSLVCISLCNKPTSISNRTTSFCLYIKIAWRNLHHKGRECKPQLEILCKQVPGSFHPAIFFLQGEFTLYFAFIPPETFISVPGKQVYRCGNHSLHWQKAGGTITNTPKYECQNGGCHCSQGPDTWCLCFKFLCDVGLTQDLPTVSQVSENFMSQAGWT